jgi:signal recognition particle subunit SEC65
MVAYTIEDKIKELDREIMQRHRVYPRLIAKGTIKRETAQRQLAIMQAIAAEYRDKSKDGPLFNFNQS